MEEVTGRIYWIKVREVLETNTNLARALWVAEEESDVAVGCAFAWRDLLDGAVYGIKPPLRFFCLWHCGF